MAGQQHAMKNPDAGDAAVYSLSSSPGRGQSDADGAKQETEPSELDLDLDRLLDKKTRNGPSCRASKLLSMMPEETRTKVERLIDQPRPDGTYVPATDIAATLTNHGWELSTNSISRHRRRKTKAGTGCACE